MKAIAIGAMIASLSLGAALAQGTSKQGTAAAGAAPAKKLVCLWTNLIDHTKAIDPKTLLFYMKDGKVWKNSLKTRCPSLKDFGFAYITPDGRICSNSQVIYVLKTHDACMLGDFELYTPPVKEKPAPDKP